MEGGRRLVRYVVVACAAGLLPAGCGGDGAPTDVTPEPQYVWWGLNWCPDCGRRASPEETEDVIIWEAVYHYVNADCMATNIDVNAFGWLENQLGWGIFMDDDVNTRPDWDYATGYWVPPSLRYQYWGKKIGVASQIVSEARKREIAITLIHETAHEFEIEDEMLAETIGWLCSSEPA